MRPLLLANIRDLDAIRVQAAGEPLAAFRVAARLDFSHFGRVRPRLREPTGRPRPIPWIG